MDIVIAMGIIAVALVAITFIILHNINKIKDKHFSLEKEKLIMKTLTLQEVSEMQSMLELFINECFDDYLAKHPNYINAEYIPSDHENIIRDDLGKLVSNRLSDGLIEKLSLYYDSQSLSNVIADKIYIKVTAYVVKANSPKK